MHNEGEPTQHHTKAGIFKRRYTLIGVTAAVTLLVAVSVAGALLLHRPVDPLATEFNTPQQAVDFPLYYPSSLPSYYFIENGSIQTNSDTVIFSISRNDGQKITVTEQKLPDNFNLSQVAGTAANVSGLGKVVIGTGFLGYRAVIATDKTLIIVSSSEQITATDFSSIVKSFRQV